MTFLRGRPIGACQRTSASGTRGAVLAASTNCRKSSQAVGPASMSVSSDAVAGPSGVPAANAATSIIPSERTTPSRTMGSEDNENEA